MCYLHAVQQHGVASLAHRRQAGGSGARRQHDLAVGVEQRQRHARQVDAVEGAVLVVDGAVAEEQRVVAEDGAAEEVRWLVRQRQQQVAEGWRGRQRQNGGQH